MEDLYNLSFAFALAAAFICLSNLFFIRVQDRMGKTQNTLFVLLLFVVAINGVCNTISAFLVPYKDTSDTALFVTEVTRYLYFIFHTALAPLFFYYVSHVCGVLFRSKASFKTYLSYIFLVVSELLALTNPLTGFVYYLDDNREFTRNWGEAVIYIASAYFLIMGLYYLTSTWRALTVKRRTGILMFAAITIAGVILQLIFSKLKIELFAEAIGLTGVMMIVENEDDRLDNETGLYNRQAFLMDLESYFLNKVALHAVCIRIITPDIISRKRGADNRELVEKKVAEFLESVHEKYNIYRIGRRTFVLLVFRKTDDEVYELAKSISDRFDRPWKLVDALVMLQSSIIVADIPKQLTTLSDAIYMFDTAKPSHEEEKTIIAGDDVNKILRGSAIEKSISNGLAEGKFEVYYQPTFTTDGRRLHGAEALVRLHDDELGMIYPDEFIPVAENMGLIDAIDDFVLLDVCNMIKEEKLYEGPVDCINVNLSVVQFMKPDFVEHINGIVEQIGVDKKLINFEVTESIYASSYEILSRKIEKLQVDGFLFSMDDYGTGYSNMRALASMDLDCIKIDKSILWEAEKNELGMIILESSVRMIRQMNKAILVEGVETEEQIKLLEKLGVDYLQGFYFSKPVPKDKFLEIVKKNSAQSSSD
ncbi:MAG: EAL domain-containing protein [Clostridiales bacterium]|nr:EAL domain-containing protein [Clostridiales bacterium]